MGVTLRDVADHANASVGTVSRVLNNAEGVDADLRRRVLASARALRYKPPQRRPKPADSTVGAVGFLLMLRPVEAATSQAGTFWADILHGAEEHVRSRGGHVIFRSLRSYEDPTQSLAQIVGLGLEAALVVGTAGADHVHALDEIGIRTVLVDSAVAGAPCAAVLSDNLAGSIAATDHLLDLGHRDIAFIGGPTVGGEPGTNSIYSIRWRALGYRTALRERGLPVRPQLVESCDLSPADAANAARRLLASGARFTAIVCANDPTAIGVLAALREAGIMVPTQVSVVGFDDIPAAATGVPPLTTVRINAEAMGAVAARALLDETAADTPVTITVPVDLIVRESSTTAPPAAG